MPGFASSAIAGVPHDCGADFAVDAVYGLGFHCLDGPRLDTALSDRISTAANDQGLSEDQLGFWERNGYHDRGDPWREERDSVEEYMARAIRREARGRPPTE